MTAAVDWSILDRDLVELIGKKFDSCTYYVRFRAVCSGWKSFLPENPPNHFQQRRFPYLALPPKSKSSFSSSTHIPLLTSFDLDDEVVDQFETPRLGGREDEFCYRGSTKGWLVVVEKQGPSIYLINPFTGDQKLLPPVNTFPHVSRYYPNRVGKEFIIFPIHPTDRLWVLSYEDMYRCCTRKVVLSSPPTRSDCIAMAIYDEGELAYCKYGHDRWTHVTRVKGTIPFCDIICYKDRFCAVDIRGTVLVVNFNSSDSSPTTMLIAAPDEDMGMWVTWEKVKLVMVETSYSHHLLLIGSNIAHSENSYETDPDTFKVLELSGLDLDSRNSNCTKWSEGKLKSLENHVLFLGQNESVSFPSHSFPGCKGNLIYFTDDYNEGQSEDGRCLNVRGSDIGVFNLENNTIKRLQRLKYPQSLWPPPVWVMCNKP